MKKLFLLFIEAVKEQQKHLENQQAGIEALRKELRALKAR